MPRRNRAVRRENKYNYKSAASRKRAARSAYYKSRAVRKKWKRRQERKRAKKARDGKA